MNYIVEHFYEISTAIFMSCFTGWIGWRAWRKTRIITAADRFRETLNPSSSINLFNSYTIGQFREVFASHREAARIYRGFFGCWKRRGFDKVWKEYQQWADNIFTESAHKPAGVYKLTLAHQGRNYVNEFKHHLDSLLKYAQKT